jgi:hypothetical protein
MTPGLELGDRLGAATIIGTLYGIPAYLIADRARAALRKLRSTAPRESELPRVVEKTGKPGGGG